MSEQVGRTEPYIRSVVDNVDKRVFLGDRSEARLRLGHI